MKSCTEGQRRCLTETIGPLLEKQQEEKQPTTWVKHYICVRQNQKSIRQRYRIYNLAMQEIIDAKINAMLRDGCIEPAQSSWNSEIVLAKKKNGKY